MDKSTAKAFTNKAYDAPDKRADVGGYKYDAPLSNVDTGIWHNHEKKLTVVANRGSVTKKIGWFRTHTLPLVQRERARDSNVP